MFPFTEGKDGKEEIPPANWRVPNQVWSFFLNIFADPEILTIRLDLGCISRVSRGPNPSAAASQDRSKLQALRIRSHRPEARPRSPEHPLAGM